MTGFWDTPPEPPTPAEKYATWRATREGQRVYDWMLGKAMALRARGIDHTSGRGLWIAARYEFHLEGDGKYGLNDHWQPFIVRELMARHPELEGFFPIRGRDAA